MKYMRLITEIDCTSANRGHLRYIRFPLDGGKDFCYRSRGSINAFAHSPKGRNWRPNMRKPERLYHLQDWDEHVFRTNLIIEMTGRNPFENIPLIDVPDIWSAYKVIGWDWKAKKYYDPKESKDE
jgi:hypothetical protein